MKLCTWNIRGCNDSLKLQEAIGILRRENLDVFGLLETRIKAHKASSSISTRLSNFRVIDNYAYHSNGRIWVIWNPVSVTVTPLIVHAQFIHCTIRHHGSNSQFQATFVYASNDPKVRENLWGALCSISSSVNSWIILGDFNVVRDISERISGHPPNLSEILDFNSCLLQCGLEDMQSTGCEFTWTNKQDGARVWCKLDRVLVNYSWFGQFPSSSTKFLVSGISDHSPALVTIFEDILPKRRFSFLNCWTADPSYSHLVQEAWDTQVAGSIMFTFFARLKHVRIRLMDLHKRKFSSIQLRIIEAKKTLEDCQVMLQESPMNSILLQQEALCLENYVRLCRVEMSILQQKAKVDNIIHNDSGTRYFYAKINERKHSQIIGEIVDHMGITKVGLSEVANAFVNYYKCLLGSSTSVQPLDTSIILLDPTVQCSDWENLVRPVSDHEVKAALDMILPRAQDQMGFPRHFLNTHGMLLDLISVLVSGITSELAISQSKLTPPC
ncbi:hypothetical protein RND81_01G056400 [Saponaria officinalis]|uniref:Endonuclease/exonuclease/phosphatase domain-containing protein n=1 Tax=Saponaria officinalis TaxID=3572 RepID=A0AAW1NGN1_SAPOF